LEACFSRFSWAQTHKSFSILLHDAPSSVNKARRLYKWLKVLKDWAVGLGFRHSQIYMFKNGDTVFVDKTYVLLTN